MGAPPPLTPSDPPPQTGGGSRSLAITRRGALTGAALVGLGAGLDRVLGGAAAPAAPAAFHGPHQSGIATPAQAFLHFAAFDLAAVDRDGLRGLLADWTAAAAALTAGRDTPVSPPGAAGPAEPGEARDLGGAGLTLTFGLGPGLFSATRLGLAVRRPAALRALPSFAGEALDPARSGGDLCIQACADDLQAAFHAVHVLTRLAGERLTLRWTQSGFRPLRPASHGQTPRNLLGFKDGTNNLRAGDGAAMARHVWVARTDGPPWLEGGTYLIARRIRMILASWDETDVREQEQTIGRHKLSGAPLGARDEFDPVDLSAIDHAGNLVIPAHAHIRLAHPSLNAGAAILRRSYAYSDPLPGLGSGRDHELDAGLFFIAFVRDPRQFITVQRRLSTGDELNAFTLHTGSSIFACPPGAQRGEILAARLLQ